MCIYCKGYPEHTFVDRNANGKEDWVVWHYDGLFRVIPSGFGSRMHFGTHDGKACD